MAVLSSVVIVGGGVGGFATAHELRARGYDGVITLVDPQGMPYDRPPLSKQYLAGERSPEQLLLTAPGWFGDARVTLLPDRVERLLIGEGAVLLASGRRLATDAVVLATGGNPRSLPIPGADSPDVSVLRTKGDADRLRAGLVERGALAVVGAGLIGAEVASTAARLGVETTLIDPDPVPLASAVGKTIAERLHAMHEAHGIRVITAAPRRLSGARGSFRLELDSGRGLDSDLVLAAIGMEPDVTLAVDARLDIDDGVLVDAGRRTSNPAILAVGDSARLRRPDGSLQRRHEHWESAGRDAATAAATLLGEDPPSPSVPWFWSDRHGVHVEAVGSMTAPGRDVIRAVDGEPQLVFRLTDDHRLVGCAAIDGGVGVRAARRIIDRCIPVEPDQLSDPGLPLKKLAR